MPSLVAVICLEGLSSDGDLMWTVGNNSRAGSPHEPSTFPAPPQTMVWCPFTQAEIRTNTNTM